MYVNLSLRDRTITIKISDISVIDRKLNDYLVRIVMNSGYSIDVEMFYDQYIEMMTTISKYSIESTNSRTTTD